MERKKLKGTIEEKSMVVFTQSQKERARQKLIHDGVPEGSITPDMVDVECTRAAKPPAAAPAKAPAMGDGKFPVKTPAKVPTKAPAKAQ